MQPLVSPSLLPQLNPRALGGSRPALPPPNPYRPSRVSHSTQQIAPFGGSITATSTTNGSGHGTLIWDRNATITNNFRTNTLKGASKQQWVVTSYGKIVGLAKQKLETCHNTQWNQISLDGAHVKSEKRKPKNRLRVTLKKDTRESGLLVNTAGVWGKLDVACMLGKRFSLGMVIKEEGLQKLAYPNEWAKYDKLIRKKANPIDVCVNHSSVVMGTNVASTVLNEWSLLNAFREHALSFNSTNPQHPNNHPAAYTLPVASNPNLLHQQTSFVDTTSKPSFIHTIHTPLHLVSPLEGQLSNFHVLPAMILPTSHINVPLNVPKRKHKHFTLTHLQHLGQRKKSNKKRNLTLKSELEYRYTRQSLLFLMGIDMYAASFTLKCISNPKRFIPRVQIPMGRGGSEAPWIGWVNEKGSGYGEIQLGRKGLSLSADTRNPRLSLSQRGTNGNVTRLSLNKKRVITAHRSVTLKPIFGALITLNAHLSNAKKDGSSMAITVTGGWGNLSGLINTNKKINLVGDVALVKGRRNVSLGLRVEEANNFAVRLAVIH